jgi:hypothetical protein
VTSGGGGGCPRRAVASGGGRSGHEREREREGECDVWVGGAERRGAAVGVKSPNFCRLDHWPTKIKVTSVSWLWPT